MGVFRLVAGSAKTLFMLIFGGIFALIGLGLIAFGILAQAKQHQHLAAAIRTQAVVVSSFIGKKPHSRQYAPQISYRYTVNGKKYTCGKIYPGISDFSTGHGYAFSERMVMLYPVKSKCAVWYVKNNPQRAFLIPRTTWVPAFLMVFGIPFAAAGLVIIGGILRGGVRRLRMMEAGY